jgi:inhibitor of cysteine peptidase
MQWQWLLVVVVAVAAVMLAAVVANRWFAEDEHAATHSLSAGDNGKSIVAKVDDEIAIALPSNPTTGYLWQVDTVDTAALQILSDDFTTGAATNVVGQGGTQTLRFRVLKEGQSTLVLKYWRSFEGDSSIVDRFTVTVTAKSN